MGFSQFVILLCLVLFERMAAEIKFPYQISLVEPGCNKELLEYFHGERTGFVQVGPEKYFFPYKYKNEAEAYYNFESRPDDVWVLTFPRSGTTWTQELVWLVANNLDFHTAQRIPLTTRFPFFEFPLFLHSDVKNELLLENKDNAKNIDIIEAIARPGYESLSEVPKTQRRFIKTHFPFSLLPPSVMAQKAKVIYVYRNVKDVAVSYYHLNRLYKTQGFIGNFERFWNYFEKGLNPWLPYYSHLKEANAHRNCSNVLFLKYEDMNAKLQSTIESVHQFLNPNAKAIDDKQMQLLLDHLNIKNFRNNPAVNGKELYDLKMLNRNESGFVRHGVSGSSLNEYQQFPGLLERVEEWIEKN